MLHVDFVGPVERCTVFIVVDAHTKWLYVWRVAQPTSAAVINVLCSLFAAFSVQQLVLSHNGRAFVSDEIQTSYQRNRIRADTAAPYTPPCRVRPNATPLS